MKKNKVEIDADDFKTTELNTRYAFISGETKDGRIYTAFQDLENPVNNWETLRTKEEIEKELNTLKEKVKIGNYYSYDGIEYAEPIENEEDIKNVLDSIDDGLCWDVYTKEEYGKLRL